MQQFTQYRTLITDCREKVQCQIFDTICRMACCTTAGNTPSAWLSLRTNTSRPVYDELFQTAPSFWEYRPAGTCGKISTTKCKQLRTVQLEFSEYYITRWSDNSLKHINARRSNISTVHSLETINIFQTYWLSTSLKTYTYILKHMNWVHFAYN